MSEFPSSLDDPKRLFALKRIAEAAANGFLTQEQAASAVGKVAPEYAKALEGPHYQQQAAQIARAVAVIFERRFPDKFRAEQT